MLPVMSLMFAKTIYLRGRIVPCLKINDKNDHLSSITCPLIAYPILDNVLSSSTYFGISKNKTFKNTVRTFQLEIANSYIFPAKNFFKCSSATVS